MNYELHQIPGGLAQLARAPALHAGGHRFESDSGPQISYLVSSRPISSAAYQRCEVVRVCSYTHE